MRFVSVLLLFVALLHLAGCGGKSGPAEPGQMTSEREQELKQAQQEAEADEKSHMTERSASAPKERTAEDEERMHRGDR